MKGAHGVYAVMDERVIEQVEVLGAEGGDMARGRSRDVNAPVCEGKDEKEESRERSCMFLHALAVFS